MKNGVCVGLVYCPFLRCRTRRREEEEEEEEEEEVEDRGVEMESFDIKSWLRRLKSEV